MVERKDDVIKRIHKEFHRARVTLYAPTRSRGVQPELLTEEQMQDSKTSVSVKDRSVEIDGAYHTLLGMYCSQDTFGFIYNKNPVSA